MSNIGDLVAMGFVLSKDGDLVLADDTYAVDDVLVLGDCYIGDALDTTGDISCGGDVISIVGSVNYFTGVIYDIDTTGNKVHFIMPFGGYVAEVLGIIWSATGAGTATIRTKVDTIDKTDFDLAFTAANEAAIDSAITGSPDYARFDANDCIFVYVQASNIANDNVVLSIVIKVVRTQEN